MGLLTGCVSQTNVGIRSEPTGAWVYARMNAPEFHAMQGVGKDGHRETPTSIQCTWNPIDGNTCYIKVIWPEGMVESKVVTLQRGSPDVRILFTKDQEPNVEVFKK